MQGGGVKWRLIGVAYRFLNWVMGRDINRF
jgi:hypothetical protein